MKTRPVLCCVLLSGLLGTHLVAAAPQKPGSAAGKDVSEVQKAGFVDPYTGGDAAAMTAAGVVAYGPFPWADFHRTTDVDAVLGERRVLWMETAHFRIGLSLDSAPWPDSVEKARALQEELRVLRKKLPKVPVKPKRLDPWLRLHLYAQRVEGCYSDVLRLLGKTDADFPAKGKAPREGAFLGLPDKFLLLLFQKKSDMGRYMDRFCGMQNDRSMRFYHDKTHQMLACSSAEGLTGFDETAVHCHVVYATIHNLINGYNAYYYQLPLWLDEGLAHWYSRKVPSSAMNVQVQDDDAVAEERKEDWPVKVRRRAVHEGAFFPFATMAAWTKPEDLGYQAHIQSWSRVDYLMQVDPSKVGAMIRALKNLPPSLDGKGVQQAEQARTMAVRLLGELFTLEPLAFDREWRDWVVKTYPKK